MFALEHIHVLGQRVIATEHSEQRALLLGHVRREDDQQLLEVAAGRGFVARCNMTTD